VDRDPRAEQADKPKGWRAQLGKALAEARAEAAAAGAEIAEGEVATPAEAGRAETGAADAGPIEAETVDAGAARRPLRKGPRLLPARDNAAAADDTNLEAEPIPSPPPRPRRANQMTNRALAGQLNNRSLTSRPLINPHLRQDPRARIWLIRSFVAFVIFIGLTIAVDWRAALTVAIVYVAADSILRSKTTSVVPSGVRVTSAQRFTRRRLSVLQSAGYVALNARKIPGTKHVIDHVVVGPAGVFTLDSQRLDRRLPIRVIDGMLYHGRTSMEPRLDHAQHEAQHAATLIAAELGKRVRVLPAMVLYGPSISWVVMKVKGVDVFDGSHIGTYFRRQTKAVGEKRLSADQIAMVLTAAANALPELR
jgi:hypothetical protein